MPFSLTNTLSKAFVVESFVHAGTGRAVDLAAQFDKATRRAYIGAHFMKLVFRHKHKKNKEVKWTTTGVS